MRHSTSAKEGKLTLRVLWWQARRHEALPLMLVNKGDGSVPSPSVYACEPRVCRCR